MGWLTFGVRGFALRGVTLRITPSDVTRTIRRERPINSLGLPLSDGLGKPAGGCWDGGLRTEIHKDRWSPGGDATGDRQALRPHDPRRRADHQCRNADPDTPRPAGLRSTAGGTLSRQLAEGGRSRVSPTEKKRGDGWEPPPGETLTIGSSCTPRPSRKGVDAERRRCKVVTAAREPPPGGLGRPLVGTARRRRAAGRTPSSEVVPSRRESQCSL